MDVTVDQARTVSLEGLHRAWPSVLAAVHRHRLDEQGAGRSTYLVAVAHGDVVGVGVLRWTGCVGEEARAAHPGAAELTDLQVVPAARGRGVGTALLASAQQHAHERGVGSLALSVDVEGNEPAARLYLRGGFRPTGLRSTCTYRGVGDDGAERTFTETSELLVLPLVTVA